MFDNFNLKLSPVDLKKKELTYEKLAERYANYSDPWGFNLETIKKGMDLLFPLYRNYFKVRVFGTENVKNEPYMVIGNHTGQIPIDGVLVTIAFAMEFDEPRILHSMVEKFLASLPFLGDLTAQTGSILGDRDNSKWLLNRGESILVFPEGVRGINKSTKDFYKVQKFSNGFYRIALQAKTKILPISIVGAEEMFPIVFQGGNIGKKFGLPSLPIPLNLVPLPSPIDIYIGKPIEIPEDISPDAPDSVIRKQVYRIENEIKKNIHVGLEHRRDFFDWARKPITKFMQKI